MYFACSSNGATGLEQTPSRNGLRSATYLSLLSDIANQLRLCSGEIRCSYDAQLSALLEDDEVNGFQLQNSLLAEQAAKILPRQAARRISLSTTWPPHKNAR